MDLLIKLNEETKRVLIVLLLALIIFFVLVGLIGALVKRIMKSQATKGDGMLATVFKAKNITDEHKMQKFAIRKNWRVLVKESWIPFLIMLGSSIIIIIYCATMNNWTVNLWDPYKTGFNTLFFTYDWSDPGSWTTVFGITVLSKWPPVLTSPHWSWEAWGAYLFVPGMTVGGTWFMICVQAYIARAFRMRKLIRKYFNPNLEEKVPEAPPTAPINPE